MRVVPPQRNLRKIHRRTSDILLSAKLYLGLALLILCFGFVLWLAPGCGKMTTKSGTSAIWCSSTTR